jgi:hypothetical protein
LQLEELRTQLHALRIRETISASSRRTKDVSLVTEIQTWTGETIGKTVHEFFAQIDTLAKVSGWTSEDKALIVKAKLQGLALQFLSGRGELAQDSCSYEDLKQALVDRFSDKLPDQYYYTRLQDAAQDRDESAEEFGDRCRKLCQRTIRKVQDEEVQRIVNEEAERRLLAAYIHGLRGVVGQQVQYQMPVTMDQAVKLAVTVENAEKHKQLAGGAKRVFANKGELQYSRCGQSGHSARECSLEAGLRDRMKLRGQGYNIGDPTGRDGRPNRERRSENGGGTSRNPPERQRQFNEGSHSSGVQCFQCQQFGPRRRDCPKWSQFGQNPNGPGSAYRSPTSNQRRGTRK